MLSLAWIWLVAKAYLGSAYLAYGVKQCLYLRPAGVIRMQLLGYSPDAVLLDVLSYRYYAAETLRQVH